VEEMEGRMVWREEGRKEEREEGSKEGWRASK